MGCNARGHDRGDAPVDMTGVHGRWKYSGGMTGQCSDGPDRGKCLCEHDRRHDGAKLSGT